MTTSDLPVRVYSPEPMLGHPAKLVGTIARDIWVGRELAWRLFIRDLSAQYRQTFLGYIWAFLPPLVASMIFIFLNSQGIVQNHRHGHPLSSFCYDGHAFMAGLRGCDHEPAKFLQLRQVHVGKNQLSP